MKMRQVFKNSTFVSYFEEFVVSLPIQPIAKCLYFLYLCTSSLLEMVQSNIF